MATLTDTIGRVLSGRYRIDAALGTGASAHVYLATDVSLKRNVAIKMLHPVLAADRSFLKRFRAEAQAAASLTHPNLVSVYDWGEDSDGPYLVLEYLGGGSVRDLLDDSQPLGAAHVAGIGAQAAHGLAYAHARGFVHRDVKPANLLFDEDRRRLCVADFGLARALAEAAWTEPVGATLGTARYAAPEQAQGRRVDGRADVYALCLVLYEALTGTVPFGADTTIGTLMARVGASLPPHEALGPLDAILRAGAAPEPEERLNAAELARRLSEVSRGLPRPGALPEGRPRQIWRPYADDNTQMGVSGSARSADSTDDTAADGEDTGFDTDAMAIAEAIGIATDAPRPKQPRMPEPAEAKPKKGVRTDDLTEIGLPAHVVETNGSDSNGDGAVEAERQQTPREVVEKSKRRRKWPWLLLALVILAGLAAGGMAVAQKRYQVFTPTQPVPNLSGLTPTTATTAVAKDHFNVNVAGHRYSTTARTGTILSQHPKAGSLLKQGRTITVVTSAGPPPVDVPNLLLISSGGCGAVQATLTEVHLNTLCATATSLDVKTGGVISYQPRTQALYGSTVNVVVSKGLPFVAVPNLTGMDKAEATTALSARHFRYAVGTSQYSSTIPTGEVLAGWTGEGKTLIYGSTVTFAISLGHAPVKVPNVKGMSQTKAIATLEAYGLTFSGAYGPNNLPVFATDPVAGTVVAYKTGVAIYLGQQNG